MKKRKSRYVKELRLIGQKLNDKGGRDTMVEYWHRSRRKRGIRHAARLEIAWDGIGGWYW